MTDKKENENNIVPLPPEAQKLVVGLAELGEGCFSIPGDTFKDAAKRRYAQILDYTDDELKTENFPFLREISVEEIVEEAKSKGLSSKELRQKLYLAELNAVGEAYAGLAKKYAAESGKAAPQYTDFTRESTKLDGKTNRQTTTGLWSKLTKKRQDSSKEVAANRKQYDGKAKDCVAWRRDNILTCQIHFLAERKLCEQEATKRYERYEAAYQDEPEKILFGYVRPELEADIAKHLEILVQCPSPNAKDEDKEHYTTLDKLHKFFSNKKNRETLINEGVPIEEAEIEDLKKLRPAESAIEGVKKIAGRIEQGIRDRNSDMMPKERDQLNAKIERLDIHGFIEKQYGKTKISIHPIHLESVITEANRALYKLDPKKGIQETGNRIVDELEKYLSYYRTEKTQERYSTNRHITPRRYYQEARTRERAETAKGEIKEKTGLTIDDQAMRLGGGLVFGGMLASILTGGGGKKKRTYVESVKDEKGREGKERKIVEEEPQASGFKLAFRRVAKVTLFIGVSAILDGIFNEGRGVKATKDFFQSRLGKGGSWRNGDFGDIFGR